MKTFWLFLVICFLCSISISAQVTGSTPTPQQEAQRSIREQQRDYNRMKNLGSPPTQTVVVTRREASPFKGEQTKAQRKLLLPDAHDAVKYAAFLQKPNTGLVKIFADIGCEGNANVIRADENCLNWIPNSAFYSFREREHTNEFLSDVRVRNDLFVADGILSQGILVSLGDVSLDNLSLESEGFEFLTAFAPEANSKDALKQTAQIIRGIKSGNFIYKKFLPITENTTYAMRVIAYRGKFWQPFRGVLYNVLEGDDRADLILAFRVVRKSADGSITLIWKELQRKEAPKIIFPKKKKSKK